MDDRAVVERQLGRPPRAFRRVARRCPFGLPAVTEQAPYDDCGEPFPTTYYLTCPHLVAALARVEAAGGVERWTAAAAADATLCGSLERAQAEQRALRRRLADATHRPDAGRSLASGIGGSSREGSLKCLHAHAAFALARPGYALGRAILAEVEPLWPARCCTSAYDPPPMSAAEETARQQWAEGHRRLEAASADRARYARLLGGVEVVGDELARRVGQIFELAQLVRAYEDADRWVPQAVGERPPEGFRAEDLAIVQDAAFHVYARGARDYTP